MNDDVERKGLGTTAARADIIEKIIEQGYVKRENTLAEVAAGTVTDTSYLSQITDFVKRVVEMYSSISGGDKSLFSTKEKIGDCPFCGGGVVRGKYGIYSREGKVRMCKFICIIRARPWGQIPRPLGRTS